MTQRLLTASYNEVQKQLEKIVDKVTDVLNLDKSQKRSIFCQLLRIFQDNHSQLLKLDRAKLVKTILRGVDDEDVREMMESEDMDMVVE